MGLARWAPAAPALAAAAAVPAGYTELRGARCAERVGDYPFGHVGGVWTEFIGISARRHCDGDENCLGFMRYTGDNPWHCREWCGRPQFCSVGGPLEANSPWTSYVKAQHLDAAGGGHGSFGGLLPGQGEPTPHREVACPAAGGGGGGGAPPVVLVSEALRSPLATNVCSVMRMSAVDSLGAAHGVGGVKLDGFLEVDDAALSYFSAERLPGGSQRYFVEPYDYPVERLGTPGAKRHFLSVYFLSTEAVCPGPEGSKLTARDVREDLRGHVYVEDGQRSTLEAAFAPYHMTILCGNFDSVPFPPAALLDAIAYAAHPLVPERLHSQLSRVLFHMQDAVQPYRTVDVQRFRLYFEDVFNDPAKEHMARFKQTFLFLCQQLLWYRYRETPERRAEVAACALCDARERRRRRELAAAAAGATGARAAVETALCAMSRRSAHELRQAVRETWGRLVLDMPGTALRFFVGTDQEPLADPPQASDVVQLPVSESYRTLSAKAFVMLQWALDAFPNAQWLLRLDDDVYLRPQPVLARLAQRPPVRYLWGNFDHGSNPARDPEHPHFNSLEQYPEQRHPLWGDVFPPYARGSLWAMSVDLLGEVAARWRGELEQLPGSSLDEAATRLPHPDDPALGVVLANLVAEGASLNVDDRDFNAFSLNPSCSSTFSGMHDSTWVVHHVSVEAMHCMWRVDSTAGLTEGGWQLGRALPDLCPCALHVEEEAEDPAAHNGVPFSYPRERFGS